MSQQQPPPSGYGQPPGYPPQGYGPPGYPPQGYGQPPGYTPAGNPQPAPPKPAWYYQPGTVVVSLLFCFPIGLVLMWSGKLWSQTARIVVSAIFGVIVLANVIARGSGGASTAAVAPGGGPVMTAAAPSKQAPTAAEKSAAQLLTESCLSVSTKFGTSSKLSDLQKDEMWSAYKGKAFAWNLEIVEVRAGVFGGYTVQAKCAPKSPSLIQDIQLSYDADAKPFVMSLQKGSTYEIRGVLTSTSTLFGLGADGTS